MKSITKEIIKQNGIKKTKAIGTVKIEHRPEAHTFFNSMITITYKDKRKNIENSLGGKESCDELYNRLLASGLFEAA